MYAIDRFEGDLAIVETDGGFLEIPRSEIPKSAAEGDILVRTESGWAADKQTAAERRAMLLRRRQKLLNGGNT